MAWDSDKSTAQDPDNPNADEQLTADEWDNHVSEGHFPGDELNFGVDGNGDPVITDPQNGGQTVMRYDRSAGSWVVDALEAGTTVRSDPTPTVRGSVGQRENFDGADADTRLDSALIVAANGDLINIERDTYANNRTISQNLQIEGINGYSNDGTVVTGDWTISSGFSKLTHFRNEGALTVSGQQCRISNSREVGGSLTVDANLCLITNCNGYTITFNSGSSAGLVDSCMNTTVTDNGTNTVGDIS